MLSLHKLEIFAIAAQEGSFSKAAERLYMTQSAISQHIGDLERSLGTKLFERGRRGVRLTSSGALLIDYTQRILNLIAEAENAITDVENLTSGQMDIGATPGINVYLLPAWMQVFQQRYPNLTISMHTDITPRIVTSVLNRQLDIGFVEGELDEGKNALLNTLFLQKIPLYVIVGQGNALWNAKTIPLVELNKQPFIMRQQNSQTRIWLDQLLAQHGLHPVIVGKFDNPESIKQAVISGMGITILPEYAIVNERQNGLIRTLPVDGMDLCRELKLVWHKETLLRPIARAFLHTLTHTFPQIKEII